MFGWCGYFHSTHVPWQVCENEPRYGCYEMISIGPNVNNRFNQVLHRSHSTVFNSSKSENNCRNFSETFLDAFIKQKYLQFDYNFRTSQIWSNGTLATWLTSATLGLNEFTRLFTRRYYHGFIPKISNFNNVIYSILYHFFLSFLKWQL